MTKRPRQPNRQHPLDRDGDGNPGGSLPGNQTAPMAETPLADETQDLPLTPTAQDQIDEAARLDAMERETDEANAAARAAAGWTRDDGRLIQKLEDIGAHLPEGHNLSHGEVVGAWTDQEAFNVETFADAMAAEDRRISAEGEAFNADGSFIDLPDVLGEWEIDFEPTPEPAATFTAEEIASGRTTVTQEDEAEAIAAELGVVIDPEDPIITVNTPTAPVAVRLKELQRLVDNRWLYKTRDGFSPNTHPPYIEDATAEVWVRAGLAQWDATAGNHGGIRVTAEARSLLVRKPEAA